MHGLPLPIPQARDRILAAVTPLAPVSVPVAQALDRVLAADVHAAGDVPGFAVSAMDGFAVTAGPAGRVLRIAGESRAGTPSPVPVTADTAVRISTGAALPDGADAVCIVERTREAGDGTVVVEADSPDRDNVREAGEDLRAGERVLAAGTRLGPFELGAAINAGEGTLTVAARPQVAVLATGDELTEPGAPLGPGRIHDSNGAMLAALAARAGADVVHVGRVADTARATREAVAGALAGADVLLLSGGVSVGEHDHVKAALTEEGVRELFWRVSLRPGGPTWAGERDGRLALGLPGNPVSAAVTFLLFARPALLALQGIDPAPHTGTAVAGSDLPRHRARTQAMRVQVRDGRAVPTGPQGSHILSSMLGADALAILEPGEDPLPAGEPVELIWI